MLRAFVSISRSSNVFAFDTVFVRFLRPIFVLFPLEPTEPISDNAITTAANAVIIPAKIYNSLSDILE